MEQEHWMLEEKKSQKGYKVMAILGIVVIAMTGFFLIVDGKSEVESLSLNKASSTLIVERSDKLLVTIVPKDLEPELVWTSSDEDVVSVMDGLVLAKKAGKAEVRVTVKSQADKYAVCEYTIEEPDVDMQTLDILEEPLVLRPMGHQQLNVSFTPENQNENILWSSSDESVVRVSSRGKLEALRVGVAHIIATSDRTGVSDTALVSVEGSGGLQPTVVERHTNQVTTPQSVKPQSGQIRQTPTQKVNPQPVSSKVQSVKKSVENTIPAKSQVKSSTASSSRKPAVSSKPVAYSHKQSSSPKLSSPEMKGAASGIKDFGYAVYKGRWPNDVRGKMEFKSSHTIDSRDPKQRVASPGDYVVGEWSDGQLVQGIWYGANNKVKGSILIGK